MATTKRPHYAGGLTPLGGNRWRLRIRLDNGQRISRTVQAADRREAEEALRVLRAQTTGAPIDTKRTVADLIDTWLPRLDVADGTRRNYTNAANKYLRPELGKIRLDRLNGWHLDTLYRKMSPHAARNTHAALRNALNHAVDWGWLATNPADKKAPKKPPKRNLAPPDPAGVDEIIAAALGPTMTTLLELVASTGMRRGEACALRWRNVNFDRAELAIEASVTERGIVKSTKTGEARTIALDAGTVALLREHRAAQAAKLKAISGTDTLVAAASFLFPADPAGRAPMNPHSVTMRFARLRARLGPEYANVRLHDLRHFVATELIGAGVDPRTVASRLGHTDPSMTLRVYAHALKAPDKRAAEVMGQIRASSS